MTKILRVDRTKESIDAGLEDLLDAPLPAVAKALMVHRVGPALYVLLRVGQTRCQDRAREDLCRLLESHYVLSQKRLAAGRSLLSECVRPHKDIGINPLVLRGPLLAEVIYPDPAMRLFGDLDLFVSTKEHASAQQALLALGVSGRQPNVACFWPTQSPDPDLQFVVELHHFGAECDDAFEGTSLRGYSARLLGVDPEGRDSLGQAYAALTPIETRYGHVRRMQDDLVLWHLCRHFTKHLIHGSATLLGLCDIAYLLDKAGFPASSWSAGSGVFGPHDGNVLYPPFLMAAKWLGARVPEGVLRNLRRRTAPSIRVRSDKEVRTFGARVFGHSPFAALRWMPLPHKCGLLLSRALPPAELLRAKGLLDTRTNVATGYYRWYRHVWTTYIKPLITRRRIALP